MTRNEAAEFLGVHPQTIANFVTRGIFNIPKTSEKKTYLFRQEVEAIKNDAKDIEQINSEIKELRQQLESEIIKTRNDINIYKQIVRSTDEYKSYVSLSNSLIRLMFAKVAKAKLLHERENEIIDMRCRGYGYNEIAERFELTPQRVQQIFEKAIRRLHSRLIEYEDLIETVNKNRKRIEELEWAYDILLKQHLAFAKKNKEIFGDKSQIALEESDTITYIPKSLYFQKITDTGELSVRALNCLCYAGIETIGDLILCNKRDLLRRRNIGKKSLGDIEDFLYKRNLSLGMRVVPDIFEQENLEQEQ